MARRSSCSTRRRWRSSCWDWCGAPDASTTGAAVHELHCSFSSARPPHPRGSPMHTRIALIVVLVVATAAMASAQSPDVQTLMGAKTVNVLIGPLPKNAETYGVTKDVLQTGVELKLRQ